MRIIRNFLSLVLSNVIGQMFALWAIVHIARTFGPDGFGKFSYAQVFVLYFLYLADFGLQTYGIRLVVQERERLDEHIWTVVGTRILLAVAGFLLVLLAIFLLPFERDVRLLIVVFSLALFPSALSLEWVFQGKEQMGVVGISRILKGVLFGLLVVGLPYNDLTFAAAAYVGGILAATAVLLIMYAMKHRVSFRGRKSLELRRVMRSAAPLAAGTFVGQVNSNLGTLALGFFASAAAVGIFSAAYKIILFMTGFVVIAAANATFPVLAQSFSESEESLVRSLKVLLRPFVLVAIPVGLGGTILAPRIIEFLYSDAYSASVPVLQVSIWMVVLMIYRVLFENALVAARRQRVYYAGFGCAGATTVIGNVVLIPILGPLAPAIVAVASEAVLLGWFVHGCPYISIMDLVRMSIKPALVGLVMALVLSVLPVDVLPAIAIGTGVYAAGLVLSGCVTLDEIRRYASAVVG